MLRDKLKHVPFIVWVLSLMFILILYIAYSEFSQAQLDDYCRSLRFYGHSIQDGKRSYCVEEIYHDVTAR